MSIQSNAAAQASAGASARSMALRIIPSSQSNQAKATSLETTMQGLVIDQRHPIALELAGADGKSSFIVRATAQAALEHAEALLRSQYPYIEVARIKPKDDPFRLEQDEEVSALELVEDATSSESQLAGQDEDLLPGVLAVLGKLPPRTRAIVQIGLVPVASNLSARALKNSMARFMGTTRTREKSSKKSVTTSMDFSLLLLINLLLAGLVYVLHIPFPGWLNSAIVKITTGSLSQVPAEQQNQLLLYALVLLLIESLLFVGIELLKQYFKNIPDASMIYRSRLRLYVIGPKVSPTAQAPASLIARLLLQNTMKHARQDLLQRIATGYRRTRSTKSKGTYLVPRRLSSREARRLVLGDRGRSGYGWARGLSLSYHLLSADVLMSLWHLPSANTLQELTFVEQQRARVLRMPLSVARQSKGAAAVGYAKLGSGGEYAPFALPPQFFRHHTLIGGKSGAGKNNFLSHIAREAMMRGGLVLIDPYGELCERVLHLVPPQRAEDVVLIDLAETGASVGLNPLDVTLGRERDKTIADLLKMLAHLWASSWGARMENAFEMGLRTLFEANKILVARDPNKGPEQQYTLLDVLPLLTNANFCHALLQDIQDDYLHRWWREYYEPLSLVQQRDVINPVISKVAKFESVVARRIVGQSVSTLNLAQMVNDKKIILLNLARGIVGGDVAMLIGATVLGMIQITLEEQGRKKGHINTRLPIILEEFHTLSSANYRSLAELQRYGVTFFLATQSLRYLQQLDVKLLPTIMANIEQVVAFRMSTQDTDLLYKELEVSQEDILHLATDTCYIALLADNQRQPTFSLKVTSAKAGDDMQAESIRTRCRVRYERSVADIDEMLRNAMLRNIRSAPSSQEQERAPQEESYNASMAAQQRDLLSPLYQEDSIDQEELVEEMELMELNALLEMGEDDIEFDEEEIENKEIKGEETK